MPGKGEGPLEAQRGLNLDLNLNLGCHWGGAEGRAKLVVEMRILLEGQHHTEPGRDTAHTRLATKELTIYHYLFT